MIAFLENTLTITPRCGGDRWVRPPVNRQHLQAKISATLLTVIWSSFLCYRWLSQAFPIKASLCTVYASVRRDSEYACVSLHNVSLWVLCFALERKIWLLLDWEGKRSGWWWWGLPVLHISSMRPLFCSCCLFLVSFLNPLYQEAILIIFHFLYSPSLWISNFAFFCLTVDKPNSKEE